MQFDFLLDLESSELYEPTQIYEERQKALYFGRYWQYNIYDRQAYIQTWRLYDRHSPEGPVGEDFVFFFSAENTT